MVECRWIALGLATVVVACADTAHTTAVAETSSGDGDGDVLGTSSEDGGGESTSGIVEDVAPTPCGEIVTDDCQLAHALAIDAQGQLVLGGTEMGPRLRIVDAQGATQWGDELGQRGSFQDVAVLPDGRIVGAGRTGSLATTQMSGFLRTYDATGDGVWFAEAELDSSFGPVAWWDAAQRLAVVVERGGSTELWFYDTNGVLRIAEDLDGALTVGIAVLGNGLVVCAGETLVHYDLDLARIGERTISGMSCGSLAGDGERLALIVNDDDLLMLDDALDEQWTAPIADLTTYVVFQGENVVVGSYGTVDIPVTLQWFSPSGEPLWTIDHQLPPTTVLSGPLAVDDDRLWVASAELDGDTCIRTRLACYAQAR